MGYSLYLVVDENTFSNYSIKYKLISTNTGGSGTVVDSSSDFIPIKTGASNTLLGFGTFNSPTGGNKVHSYTLEFYFPNLPFDQSIDQGKTFKAHINIKDYNLENDRIISSIDLMEKSKKAEMLYQYSDMLWDTVNKISDQLSEEQLDYYNDLSNQYENQSDNLWDEIYSSNFLNTSIARYEIESIEFVESNIVPVSAIGSFDVSEKQNGSVMLWYEPGINPELYKITIGQNDGVNAPIHSDYLFSCLNKLYTINGNFNTKDTTTMSEMFSNSGYNESTFSLNINSWDTSNVTDMSNMFLYTGYNTNSFNLDLSSWDTSNVTDMSNMFKFTGNNSDSFNVNLSSFDTSSVTDMSSMFYNAGSEALTWSIGSLNSWNTTKVTNMYRMFYQAGGATNNWSIGNLSTWDTSNVIDMTNMFTFAGNYSNSFNLDLSSWDTSNVIKMTSMFYNAGSEATTWSLGDISSWNTSNVIDMSWIFGYAGSNASTWSIGDISTWNLSKLYHHPCDILGEINTNWDYYFNALFAWDCG